MKFLARQPILNRARDLFGYELLFRNGIQNSCDGLDLELASASVLDTSFLIGFEKLSAGHPMFFNCPRDFCCGIIFPCSRRNRGGRNSRNH